VIAANAKQITILDGAHILVSGDKKLMVADVNHDLCAICWSPLKTLMEKAADETQDKLKAK
jgi:sulfite reductase alpha subunit-like flavoprotein